jgi:hypothetical protein
MLGYIVTRFRNHRSVSEKAGLVAIAAVEKEAETP